MNIVKEKGVFFIEINGSKNAHISFVEENGVVIIEHTLVASMNKGQGLGKKLVQEVAGYARENKLKLDTTCSFARAVLDQTEEVKDVYIG